MQISATELEVIANSSTEVFERSADVSIRSGKIFLGTTPSNNWAVKEVLKFRTSPAPVVVGKILYIKDDELQHAN